jgi:uncharacterized membrane protein (DUF485 family)
MNYYEPKSKIEYTNLNRQKTKTNRIMTIEILDWIIYIILCIIIWKFLPEDCTEEIGALIGITIMIIFTIIYAITFSFLSWNDDIIKPLINGNFINWIKIKW